jgi:hypothetical protein
LSGPVNCFKPPTQHFGVPRACIVKFRSNYKIIGHRDLPEQHRQARADTTTNRHRCTGRTFSVRPVLNPGSDHKPSYRSERPDFRNKGAAIFS